MRGSIREITIKWKIKWKPEVYRAWISKRGIAVVGCPNNKDDDILGSIFAAP